MKKNLYIIGAGSHSNVIIDLATSLNYKIIFIVDINSTILGHEKKFGIPVKDKSFIKKIKKNSMVFLAIGNNHIRKIHYQKYKKHFKFVNLISKSCKVSKYSNLGEGNYIGPNVIINAGVVIKNNCILNTSSIIEHDVVVDNNVHICPSVTIGGNCKIGDETFLGLGSNIIDNILIGKKVVLGAGSLVTKTLKSHSTYFGVPAKRQRIYKELKKKII